MLGSLSSEFEHWHKCLDAEELAIQRNNDQAASIAAAISIWIADNPTPHQGEKLLRRVARLEVASHDWRMGAKPSPSLFASNWEKLAVYLKEITQRPRHIRQSLTIAAISVRIGVRRSKNRGDCWMNIMDRYFLQQW
jgi:hypothetical protein